MSEKLHSLTDSTAPLIEITRLAYQNSRTPYSVQFEDIYFYEENGLAESQYIYLEGTRLADRIRSGQNTTVGEIGFGVGLNFCLTLKEFNQNRNAHQKLTYITTERYPVHLDDLKSLYALYPELSPYSDLILKHYPILTPGFHSIWIPEYNLTWMLLLGDANEMISQLQAKVDIWYWDGFAPSRNPDAFSEKLFLNISKKSAPHCLGASYSVASAVRQHLEKSGFKIEKRSGFGNKRECLTATLQNPVESFSMPPWFSTANCIRPIAGRDRIGIIGAGFAGSALARSFLRRGFEVHVIDQAELASHASGNSVGLFNIQVSKVPNPISRFSRASLASFLREIQQDAVPVRWGIFRQDEQSPDLLSSIGYPKDFFELITAKQASEIAGVKIEKDGIYLPFCGSLNPKTLVQNRFKNNAKLHLHQKIDQIIPLPHSIVLKNLETGFQLEVEHLIYATGAESIHQPLKLQDYPMKPIRGQVISVRASLKTEKLNITLVDQGYIAPVGYRSPSSELVIGATYQSPANLYTADCNNEDQQIDFDTQALLNHSHDRWATFRDTTVADVQSHRVAYRSSTPDKLPIIGPRVDLQEFSNIYTEAIQGAYQYKKSLQRNAEREPLPASPVCPREWIFTALGSRGIAFSSLGAELLVQQMLGEALGIETEIWQHLHASRFFVRDIKRTSGKIKS
jgi:tRNA 5-methylaminomethyl-2-thiouridine biosynthesis bifunctional protein